MCFFFSSCKSCPRKKIIFFKLLNEYFHAESKYIVLRYRDPFYFFQIKVSFPVLWHHEQAHQPVMTEWTSLTSTTRTTSWIYTFVFVFSEKALVRLQIRLQNTLDRPTNILKYVHNQLWHSFNYSMRRWDSPSLPLCWGVWTLHLFLGTHDEDRIFITAGWSPLFSSLFWIVLSKCFHKFAFLVKFNVASSGKRLN